jgi:NTP pyrophosphatase (non-canonical NTP hydrolase)
MTFDEISFLVKKELRRQIDLKSSGKFTYTAEDYAQMGKLHVNMSMLTEEIGEVARAINEDNSASTIPDLKAELIQVIAVATSWLMGL